MTYDTHYDHMTGFKSAEEADEALAEEMAAGFIGPLERPYVTAYRTRQNQTRYAIVTIERTYEP